MELEITFGVPTAWQARRAYRRLANRLALESMHFDVARRRAQLCFASSRTDEVFNAIQDLGIPVYVVYAVEARDESGP